MQDVSTLYCTSLIEKKVLESEHFSWTIVERFLTKIESCLQHSLVQSMQGRAAAHMIFVEVRIDF